MLNGATTVVFPCQTAQQHSDGNHPNGVSNAGRVSKKRDSGRISGFAAYRSTVLSTVGIANCEKQSRDGRTAASVEHTAASVVRCSHKTTTKCL